MIKFEVLSEGLYLERSELWISDEHDGLIKSIEECFPGQQRQRCIIHWMRNAQSKVSKADLVWLMPLLKDVVCSGTKESFELAWKELIKVVETKGRDRLSEWLDSTYLEITVYLEFPPAHWTKIKCTNSLERLNEELRRREKCIRIFPDENSCNRLIGAILQGYSEDWTCGKIYLTMPTISPSTISPFTISLTYLLYKPITPSIPKPVTTSH
ncbi:MAG: transposase [Candidatus Cloacimonadaceae bacterium]|nr:transposase [Candidatus Cloacimonadaceae bacterium]